MKILTFAPQEFIETTEAHDRAILALTDASLLTSSKPQFLPDLSHEYKLYPAAAIVIRNTGKKIAPRFIHRYCEWITPVAFLIDVTELHYSRQHGLPYTRAVSFDYNVARGSMCAFSEEAMDNLALQANAGTETCRWATSDNAHDWRERLSEMSRIFTFRTGDIIIPATGAALNVSRDTRIKIEPLNSKITNCNFIFEYNIK